MADEVMAPPDVNNTAPPPTALTGTPPPQPATPPKESFGEGFARAGAGESYAVDDSGRMQNTRTTRPSIKGMLGSILAGATLGALHGATAARPGGIPSEQLGGGAGEGAKAATDFLEKRDLLKRQQATEQFQQQQSVKKMSREEAESAAQINSLAAQTAHMIQETKHEADLHPFDVRMKQAGLDEALANVQNTRQTIQKNQLNLLQDLASNGIDPSAVITSWSQARTHVQDIAQGKTLPLYNGQGGGDDHGVAMFDTDSLRRPLTKDVTFSTYATDKDGNPVEQKHTIKAGASSVMDYISGAMSGQAQLQKIMSQQKVSAESDKNKADAQEARAKAGLDEAQIDFFKKGGVHIPENYTPPPNPFAMKPQELTQNLSSQGVTVPPVFAALYATGHYKGDLNTFPARTTNRPGMPQQMDQATAETFIRTFINPNYDRNNFGAVKKMEDEFASSKSGSAGGNLLSFNTATGHLAQLYDAAKALQTGDQQTISKISQAIGTEFGSPVKPSFEAIKGVLVGELGRLMKQSAPDVNEMSEISKALSAANSPEQFKNVVEQYAHAMLQKGLPLVQKYADYTGELPPSTFSQQTLATFKKLGIDVQSMLPQGVAIPVGQTGNQNPAQISQKSSMPPPVPTNVQAALSNVGPGQHTLSDKSVWNKAADGTITPGTKAQ